MTCFGHLAQQLLVPLKAGTKMSFDIPRLQKTFQVVQDHEHPNPAQVLQQKADASFRRDRALRLSAYCANRTGARLCPYGGEYLEAVIEQGVTRRSMVQ
jgi:hypothetical protein